MLRWLILVVFALVLGVPGVFAEDRGVTDRGTIYNDATEKTTANLGDASGKDPGEALKAANDAATSPSSSETPMVTEDFWGVDEAVKKNEADDKARAEAGGMTPGTIGAWAPSGTDLRKTTFHFDPSQLSPSTQTYKSGTGNIQKLLTKIANFLLIVVSTFAVLFIAVGGFMMAISAGDSDRATKGRTIVTYNIQALVVAMFAYGIVQFVLWVVWNP